MQSGLLYPAYSFKFKTEGAKQQIFDAIRLKWVALSPEEWVRQHVIRFLQEEKGFPAGLTSIETGIDLHGLKRRCDIVYYSAEHRPLMIVECKAPDVKIDQQVFDQIWKYNLKLQVPYLLITNGQTEILAHIGTGGQTVFLKEIPLFRDL